jgi:hypothetical protein
MIQGELDRAGATAMKRYNKKGITAKITKITRRDLLCVPLGAFAVISWGDQLL